MTNETMASVTGRRWLPMVLAVGSLAALAACGDDERLSRDAFSDRLQFIDRQGSARYEQLADRAMRLKPDQPLTEEVKQGMRHYAEGLASAANALDELNPPEAAEDESATLADALRQRADAFERAAREERTTLRELERQGSITRAGDKIDRAFDQLRKQGFLRRR